MIDEPPFQPTHVLSYPIPARTAYVEVREIPKSGSSARWFQQRSDHGTEGCTWFILRNGEGASPALHRHGVPIRSWKIEACTPEAKDVESPETLLRVVELQRQQAIEERNRANEAVAELRRERDALQKRVKELDQALCHADKVLVQLRRERDALQKRGTVLEANLQFNEAILKKVRDAINDN